MKSGARKVVHNVGVKSEEKKKVGREVRKVRGEKSGGVKCEATRKVGLEKCGQ